MHYQSIFKNVTFEISYFDANIHSNKNIFPKYHMGQYDDMLIVCQSISE